MDVTWLHRQYNIFVVHDPVRILVSSCLLGEKVRYDGGHKRDPFILEMFGEPVQWVPVCPEVECGLSTPREPMRLAGDPAAPRLVGAESGVDHTERMMLWAGVRLRDLETLGLCGYICKKNSPSCSGVGRMESFGGACPCATPGTGIFTKAFSGHFPLVPVEEEGRLRDSGIREMFLEKVFALARRRGPRN